jgi:hypothetical protein
MRLTNAPTNALRGVTNAHADARTNAPTNAANALRTRPPIPPRPFVPRARPLAPLVRLAFGHGCAVAALASKRSDHPNDDHLHGLQKGRIDLVTPLRVLIFNATPSARSPANPCRALQRESSVRLCVSAAPRRRAAHRRTSGLAKGFAGHARIRPRQPILQTRCRHTNRPHAGMHILQRFVAIDHMMANHGKGVFARVATSPSTLSQREDVRARQRSAKRSTRRSEVPNV